MTMLKKQCWRPRARIWINLTPMFQRVYEQPNYLVTFDREYSAVVTPSAPIFFQLDIPDDVQVGILIVHSDDDPCMTLSVQNITWCCLELL